MSSDRPGAPDDQPPTPPVYGPPGDEFQYPQYESPNYQPPQYQPPQYQPPQYQPPQYQPPQYQPPQYQPYQPPYGQPAYSQPAYPAYGAPAYGPPLDVPPPPTRRKGLWIGLGVGAFVLVAALIVAVVAIAASDRRSGPSHTLAVPAQFGSHSLLTTAAAADVKARVKDSFLASSSDAAKVLSNAQIGVYGPEDVDDQPSVIFFGVSATDSREARNLLHSETDRAHTNEFLDGATATGVTEYDAGPLGGSLKCGQVSATDTVCSWADYSTLGVVIFYDGTPQHLAAEDALALRNAAEH